MTDQEFQRLNQAYTQKYGAQKAPSSGGGTIDDFDRAVQQRRAAKKSEQTQKQQEEKGLLEIAAGFGKEAVKGIARPIAKTAVTGLSAADAAISLAMGDQEAAEKRLTEGYNVPGLGQIRPVGGGTVDQSTGQVRYQTAGENLRDIVGTGAEIAPYFMTGGAAGAVKSSLGAKGIFSAIKTGTKLGAIQGGIGSAGQSLQSQDASAGKLAKDTVTGALAGGLIGGATSGVGALLSKGAGTFDGSLSKIANRFSTIDEDAYNAAKNPETAKQLQALRRGVLPEANIPEVPDIPKVNIPKVPDLPEGQAPTKLQAPDLGVAPGSPDDLRDIGKAAYETALAQKSAAGEAYAKTRKAIIDANEGKLIQRSKEFVKGARNALNAEGITIKNGKVDLTGSQFEGADGAKSVFQRVHDIMSRPAKRMQGRTVAEDLLARREALSNIIGDISPEQANLRRVVGNMREAFDNNLDSILGPEAGAARSAYAGSMKVTKPVIDSMTKVENGKRVFSEDKAYAFIDKALKDTKFDNAKLLQELDSIAGSAHASDITKIQQGRVAYQRAVEEASEKVAKINARAQAEFAAAKAARAKALSNAKSARAEAVIEANAKRSQAIAEAKRARAVAQAEYDGKLAALKQLNKALTSLSPEVTDSLLGTMLRGINGLPIIGKLTPFFAPKFWGDIALSRGLNAASRTGGPSGVISAQKAAQLWVLTNLIAHESIKDGLDE